MALGAHHPRIKRLRRLVRRRSSRRDEAAFVVEGPGLVSQALDAGLEVEAVFVDGELAAGLDRAVADRAILAEVEPGVLHRVLSPSSPQPVAAVVIGKLTRPLDEVLGAAVARGGCVVALVDVSDPGNVGTIIRSAEAAGCVGVVSVGSTADLTNPKTLRASAGSALRLALAEEPSVDELLAQCRRRGVRTVASVARGGRSHREPVARGPVVLVMGNEAQGLDDAVSAACDETVTVEMAGPTESLNVAMAATLLAFEMTRPPGARDVAPARHDAG